MYTMKRRGKSNRNNLPKDIQRTGMKGWHYKVASCLHGTENGEGKKGCSVARENI